MSSLSSYNTIIYNGFTFPTETETISIVSTPVESQQGTHTAYVKYLITLRFYMNAGSKETLANNITTARQLLLENGGAFQYQFSFGAFSLNSGSTPLIDVNYGPKIRSFSVKPIGGSRTVVCEWSAEIALPFCAADQNNGVYSPIKDFSYTTSYSTDGSGYLTITRNVMVEVVGSFFYPRGSANADTYFEQFDIPVPDEFRVVSRSRTISADKTRLDIAATFEQMPYPLPPGVISCNASHSHANAEDNNFALWSGTIDASYEMSAVYPKESAFEHFMTMAMDRINKIRQSRRLSFPFGNVMEKKPVDKPTVVIIKSLSMTNPSIFGRPAAAFSLSYTIAMNVQALLVEGLWEPVPGTSFQRWKQSLADNAFHPRGLSKYRNTGSVAVIDLCTGVTKPAPSVIRELRSVPNPRPLFNPQRIAPVVEAPSPVNSWMDYKCIVQLLKSDRTVVHAPIQSQGRQTELRGMGGRELNNITSAKGYVPDQAGPVGDERMIVQQTGSPIWYVRLIGYAKRAGYPISPPRLISYAGRKAYDVSDMNRGGSFSTWVDGAVGVNIVNATWDNIYVLDGPPKSGLVADNPFFPRDKA